MFLSSCADTVAFRYAHRQGKGLRVPSYTDRVLHHSLPDVKDRLKCIDYYLCDQLTSSDHRYRHEGTKA